MKTSYNIKEVDKLLKSQNKNAQDVEIISSFLYGLPYFQKLFSEIHQSLIPKLIRKFHFGQCQSGGAIIQNGDKIKDFFIILEGSCLEMSKNKQQDADTYSLLEDLDKTPFLKILKQSEERKKSLLFQQTPTQLQNKSLSSKFKDEMKIDSVDEAEQTASIHSPIISNQQKSLFCQNNTINNQRPEFEDFFVQQYKKKYEKKGYCILNTLKEGDYFGGITKKGAEQTFSDIVCCTKVEYVCLAYEDYWNILSQYQLRICEQKISFLRSYRFLSIYTDHYLNKRLNMFEEISLYRNQALFEENDDSLYIYFIMEGEFVMHKNVDFKKYYDSNTHEMDTPNNMSVKNRSQSLYRQGNNSEQTTAESEESTQQNHQYSHLRKNIIISYLNQGSYIGLSEILTESKYTYTVSCYSTQAKVYRLYRQNFEKFFQCEANIEIMAQDCLGKEKIYDEILTNHALMMKEEYCKVGKSKDEKDIMQIFETNQKRNGSIASVVLPTQQKSSQRQNRQQQLSVMEQRIKDKLKSQSVKFSKKDIQKEKAQHLQDTILNSIHNDPYFRRKLLSNLSSLGFKINQDNCNIFNQLKLHSNIQISRTSSLANLQEYVTKQKQETPQPQTLNHLEQIPEIVPSSTSINANASNPINTTINNPQSSRNTLRQNFFNTTSQQELQRKRLSFILGQQEKKSSQLKSNSNIQQQAPVKAEYKELKSHLQNSPSIEDLKCFENNITYRKENDNESESQPCSPQGQNEYSNFNSKTSIIFANNEHEFLTATIPEEVAEGPSKQHSVHQQKQRMSSLSPQSTFVAFQETTSSKMNQGAQHISQTSSNQNSQVKKVPFVSRKLKLEATLSNENKQKQSITPNKQQDDDYISPIISPFQTFRQQLLNNFNKGVISQPQSEVQSPIKAQQTNCYSNQSTIQFNNINLQQLNSQNQRSNSQLSYKFNNFNETINSSPTDPSDRRKLKFTSITNNNNNSSLQQQQDVQTITVLTQCSHNNNNSNRLLSSASGTCSLPKRQSIVKNIQFNLQGGQTPNINNINIDYKQYLESNQNTQNNNQNQIINLHRKSKSQKSFRDKLHILVDKHIQENINNKKSYILNHNKSTQYLNEQMNQNVKSNPTNHSSRLHTNTLQLDTLQSTSTRYHPTSENQHVKNIHSEQTSPKLFNIVKKKQTSFLGFQSIPSYTQLNEQQETTANNNFGNTTIQSPLFSKNTSRVLFKRSSIPLMSPTSTKITQLSTAHCPSFSSFQTVVNKNHSRMPSDQSCSNIIQNLVKNQVI